MVWVWKGSCELVAGFVDEDLSLRFVFFDGEEREEAGSGSFCSSQQGPTAPMYVIAKPSTGLPLPSTARFPPRWIAAQ